MAAVESADDIDPIEAGVALLQRADLDNASMKDVVDRVEAVTTDPATTRQIIDSAVMRGVIDRDQGVVNTTMTGTGPSLDAAIVKRDVVDADCARCGQSISTGHFVVLESQELGPFGGTCIDRVRGR